VRTLRQKPPGQPHSHLRARAPLTFGI
jgi:hypothetical protein